MPKKSNTKRADGRYAVQVYLGRDQGKRKYKTVYGATQKEADRKAEEIKAKLHKGIDVSNASDFSTWSDHYLSYKKSETSDDQYSLIKSRVEFWNEKFLYCKIADIRPLDVRQALDDLAERNPYTGKPTSKRTLSFYLQIIRSIFDYAIDNRVIEYNPASRVKVPNAKQSNERRALTQEERQRVIAFKHRGQLAIMLMMLSGLRRGEATALQWSDIDFDNHTITVDKSYNFKSSTIKPPKNGKSRVVTVPQILTDFLKTVEKKSIYVITSANGKMMTEIAWKRLLDSYLYDMNLAYGNFTKDYKKHTPEKIPMVIQPFTLHCLRHTFCTMMYEAGVDVLVAQQQMGHSDVKTTLSIYTHLQQEHQVNNISALDKYLKNSANNNGDASHMQVSKQ